MLFVRRNSCVAPSGFTCNVQQNPVVEQASSGVTFCGAYGHFTSRKPNGSSAFDASKTAPSVVAPKYGCSVLMWNPQGATDVWVAMNPLVPDVLMDSEGFMVNVTCSRFKLLWLQNAQNQTVWGGIKLPSEDIPKH